MSRIVQNILVTGGAGFIGANFIKYLFSNSEFTGKVVNLDALTYAGNLDNLREVENQHLNERYFFIKSDITRDNNFLEIFTKYQIDTLVHFAAETHVDRSILGPAAFLQTNILGTFNLLEAAKKYQQGKKEFLFHHISTDEVFGSLGETGLFSETTSYDPRSPYSASKASSDHLVRAYFHTYGLPITISNCSNNYGPFQFPEKLIPFMILNILEGKPLPVYGDGKNIRDWLHVEDHAQAIYLILKNGKLGESYNIGGGNEWTNIDLLHLLIELIAPKIKKTSLQIEGQITYVKDRLGHDRRYAIDFSKIASELGYAPKCSMQDGLDSTINWYLENSQWISRVKTGEYKNWVRENYASR